MKGLVKLKIINFSRDHIEQASQIAKQNYEEERGFVPTLPLADKLPELIDYANNNRGIAAVDGGELIGFFCWYKPWENHFGLCKGTWSPIHAHGAINKNRADIYDRLYQEAAEKLVSDGVFSHSVTLYEHDAEANNSFFQNGFGRRCVDAIRETIPIDTKLNTDIVFRQAGKDDAETLTDMYNKKNIHLSQSPIFMPFINPVTVDDIMKNIENNYYQYFISLVKNQIVAYYRIQKSGENFACDDPFMMNITGAYALPEVRGQGISVALLSWLMDWLREHDYTRCGVDFECFNYTARKFWLKYFTAYTNGAVRRIDERIYQK